MGISNSSQLSQPSSLPATLRGFGNTKEKTEGPSHRYAFSSNPPATNLDRQAAIADQQQSAPTNSDPPTIAFVQPFVGGDTSLIKTTEGTEHIDASATTAFAKGEEAAAVTDKTFAIAKKPARHGYIRPVMELFKDTRAEMRQRQGVEAGEQTLDQFTLVFKSPEDLARFKARRDIWNNKGKEQTGDLCFDEDLLLGAQIQHSSVFSKSMESQAESLPSFLKNEWNAEAKLYWHHRAGAYETTTQSVSPTLVRNALGGDPLRPETASIMEGKVHMSLIMDIINSIFKALGFTPIDAPQFSNKMEISGMTSWLEKGQANAVMEVFSLLNILRANDAKETDVLVGHEAMSVVKGLDTAHYGGARNLRESAESQNHFPTPANRGKDTLAEEEERRKKDRQRVLQRQSMAIRT